MKRVLILAEGQTEERFVKDILQAHLLVFGIAHAYLMLHEYEAMLFSGTNQTAEALNEPRKAADLQAIRDGCSGPEKIDDGANTAPSKRVSMLFPGYQKALHGPLIIGRIGLDQVRASCAHFNEWLTALEAL